MVAFYKERSGNYIADIVTSKTFVYAEKDITASKLNQIISGAVIQPSFVTAKPASSTLDPTDQLLEVKGAGTYATITGQQLIDSVSASVTQNITPTIWSVRLRSFNSVGNPTLECDQRNAGAGVAVPSGTIFGLDRFTLSNAASGATFNFGKGDNPTLGGILVPGTNFKISNSFCYSVLTAQKVSLAAGDAIYITQVIEGPRLRELINDVHSVSIIALTNVAGGLKFGLTLRDPGSTRSLSKLCTIPANAWTLVSLPNLPIFPAAGNFSLVPGSAGYTLAIALAAGTTFTAPANDTWQNGNFLGAVGQDNFAAKPVNSYLYLGFIQHEPGAQCSTSIDCPFIQNYDDCLRYYQKTYSYPVKPGTADVNGTVTLSPGGATAFGPTRFFKSMAKVPTMTAYSPQSGAVNTLRDTNGNTDRAVTAFNGIGDGGFQSITATGVTAVLGNACYVHWTADTGW